VQQRGGGQLSVDELIRRRDRGDADPEAAAKEVARALRKMWNAMIANVGHFASVLT